VSTTTSTESERDDWDVLKERLRADPQKAAALDRAQRKAEAAAFLVAARHHLGLSQRALARLSQIDQSDLAKMESGQTSPTWETLSRILDAMDAEVTLTVRNAEGESQVIAVKQRPSV
jgi:ribosome-binding protein aMBF1 (putative translation factor)